jgi:hypothetical protein
LFIRRPVSIADTENRGHLSRSVCEAMCVKRSVTSL